MSGPTPKHLPLTVRQAHRVERNRGLAGMVATRLWRQDPFVRRIGSLEDAIQVGMLGLMRAALRYDPHHGARFSTYACHVIWAFIRRAACRDGPIKLPQRPGAHEGEANAAAAVLQLNLDFRLQARESSPQDLDLNGNLRRAIEALPANWQRAITRYYGLDGLEPEDIKALACRLKRSRQRVHQWLCAARKRLRLQLQDISCANGAIVIE